MTQFKTITFKGFEALVTARVIDSHIIYLEMSGDEAQVRAIWARLVSADAKKKGWLSDVQIGEPCVSVDKHVKYATLRTPLPNGQQVVALAHPSATIAGIGSTFYLVAPADHEGPPPAFFPRLAQALAIPVKEEWAGWLWEKGREYGEHAYQRLILKLAGDGHVAGYRVSVHDAQAWLKLIQGGLGFKLCERCDRVADELVEHEERDFRDLGSGAPKYITKMICLECHDDPPKSEETSVSVLRLSS